MDKAEGDEVYAGTVNGEGALYVEVTKSAAGSLFGKIIKLVEEAQAEVPDSQRFIERFEGIYARVVVGVTLMVIAGAPLLLGWTWNEAFIKPWFSRCSFTLCTGFLHHASHAICNVQQCTSRYSVQGRGPCGEYGSDPGRGF